MGVGVGHYYLYWLKDAGGWAVHPQIGSQQAMLFYRFVSGVQSTLPITITTKRLP